MASAGHDGEIALQERTGFRNSAKLRQVIRTEMPPVAADFLAV